MKKFLTLVMVLAMVACFASIAFAAPAGQVAYYDMDDTEGLTVNGEGLVFADGAVTFDGTSYLVADVDLKGADALTIAVRLKADGVTGGQWPFQVSSDEINNWPKEHYIGCLVNNVIAVERYNSTHLNADGAEVGRNATAVNIAYTPDEWVDLVCVFPADGATIVYVDGVEVANVPAADGQDVAIANCIGETPVFQIGKANWGEAGEFYKGAIDTVAIYTSALSAEEVASAFEAPAADAPAPQTGFVTVALAIVALGSGAYIVSKKH